MGYDARHITKESNQNGECMSYKNFIWDTDDDPEGNVEHIAQHGLGIEEIEDVLRNPDRIEISRSSGFPIAFGTTETGRYIVVVYEEIDADTARPITAYEP
jgi:uncharacterized DUF497 family protein